MAAKIKDGLFIGDAETSQSEIFINDNKISNLINLSGREVPNVWASHGLVYLTYNWEDRPDYRLFSGHEDSILTDIVEFVDVSIAHGISVLMFSKKGTGRSAVAACLYLMVKYRWGFEKSYDYVYSKKPDIDLNKGFIQQMFALDMKLVASRQKAYALKHGIENTFKIEPNMTINDIAAMLPPTEAKRWNSWDPAYVLTPNSTSNNDKPITQDNIEEVVTWQKYADSVISALRKKDQIVTKVMVNKQKGNLRALDDAEEELVLIFSFINAKNTISTLPGPYYNAYEVQKQFALRFDSIVFEEDVNWFPTSPTNSRYTYAPKGILKGGTRPLLTAPAKVHSSPVHAGADSKPSSSNVSSNGMGSREDKHALSPPHVGLANPRNSIEIRPSSNATNTTNTNTNKSNNAHGYGDDDLLKYVGVSSATSAAQSKEEPYSHLNSNNTASNSNSNNVAQPKRSAPTSAYDDKAGNASTSSAAAAASADYDRKPMTAEERLRKLMADMERQKPAPSQPSSASRSSTGGRTSSNNNSNTESNSATPSLYDLANMQVHASASSAPGHNNPRGGGRNAPQDFSVEDFDEDEDLDDPLAAFDVPTQATGANSRGSSSAAASSNVASGKTGALRARHDILSSTSTGPSSRSSGYNTSYATSNAPGGRSSLNNTTGGTRQQAWGSSSSNVSNRYASPSSVRSNSHVPSSNSSIASQGSDNPRGGAYVGSGTTSGTQVYRHGSPAPNNRPNPSSSGVRRTTGSAPARGGSASSNNSVGSERGGSLSGVYGTGLGGSSTNNNTSGRFSPVPSPSTSKSTRYSSPFAAAPSSTSAAANNNLPQRRGSNTSITSVGSFGSNNNNNSNNSANVGPAANSNVRRSVGNASPLRASYGGSGSSGNAGSRPASPASFSGSSGYNNSNNAPSGVPTKRFSTPTPHDYDPNNMNNNNNNSSNNGRPGSASSSRNNTPSKATWRF